MAPSLKGLLLFFHFGESQENFLPFLKNRNAGDVVDLLVRKVEFAKTTLAVGNQLYAYFPVSAIEEVHKLCCKLFVRQRSG